MSAVRILKKGLALLLALVVPLSLVIIENTADASNDAVGGGAGFSDQRSLSSSALCGKGASLPSLPLLLSLSTPGILLSVQINIKEQ